MSFASFLWESNDDGLRLSLSQVRVALVTEEGLWVGEQRGRRRAWGYVSEIASLSCGFVGGVFFLLLKACLSRPSGFF